MSRTTMRITRVLAVGIAALAIAGLGATTAQAAPAAVGTQYYPISGVGSTWSANALQQWSRNVWSNYQWKVTYSDQGSSAGRQLFSQPNGGYDFAVSEIPYQLKDSDSLDPRPARKFAYMPIVAGGTSFMYNLVIAGKRVTNLRLGGETVSKIFAGDITKWNDAAIAADNPGLALPAIPIVPVVRSDGSGTSAQLSSWMRAQYPDTWNHLCQRAGRSANCGITSNFPVLGGFKAQSGSNGVAGYVSQTQYVGSITYVEYSYALNDHFPVAKILNAGGYYTEPTAANVAVALLKAQINPDESSPDYLTQILSGVYTNPDPRTYPLSSYSYMLIPTALEYGFTENKGLTLAAFANYFLCEGQQQADVLGYSPLPVNLAQAGLDQVLKIPGGDPKDVNIAKCNNPTFTTDGSNKLANTAPQPQACDKQGATQCTTGTGGAADVSTASSATGTKTAASASTSGAGTAASSGAGAATDRDGKVADAANDTRPLTVAGTPQTLASSAVSIWPGVAIAIAAGAAVLVAILLPPILGTLSSRAPPRTRRTRTRTVIPRVHLRSGRPQRAPGSSTKGVS
jgi:phosphate ABC transporter phosphate-binding protein